MNNDFEIRYLKKEVSILKELLNCTTKEEMINLQFNIVDNNPSDIQFIPSSIREEEVILKVLEKYPSIKYYLKEENIISKVDDFINSNIIYPYNMKTVSEEFYGYKKAIYKDKADRDISCIIKLKILKDALYCSDLHDFGLYRTNNCIVEEIYEYDEKDKTARSLNVVASSFYNEKFLYEKGSEIIIPFFKDVVYEDGGICFFLTLEEAISYPYDVKDYNKYRCKEEEGK